jgi:hypothetical protein
MDHSRIEPEKIIDRYLARELSPEDEELFEEHLFACADCLEQVQYGEALRQGLRAVAAEEGARAAASRGLLALALPAWLRSRRTGQRLALAGLALVLLALPALLLRPQNELGRLRAALSSVLPGSVDAPISDLQVVTLGVVRSGENETAELRLDPHKRAVLLSLELPSPVAPRYRATLLDAEGQVRWRGEDLEPNLYGTLVIVVPSSFLTPGNYQIHLATPSADGPEPAGTMRFRVVAASSRERKGSANE